MYPVVYCAFDLLEVDGDDLAGRPFVERRARLAATIGRARPWRSPRHGSGDSERRFADACRSGWEGLIAKRADAPYAAGRSKDWLKLKCVWEQEFVVAGYTDPTGSRSDFGALLVGFYERAAFATPGRSAPASLRRCSTTSVPSCEGWRPRRIRLWTSVRSRVARTGRGRTSWFKSDLPSGQATLGCAKRGFSVYATTSAQPTSSVRSPNEPRAGIR